MISSPRASGLSLAGNRLPARAHLSLDKSGGGSPTPPRIDSFMPPPVATRRLSAPTPYPTLPTTWRGRFGHWLTSIAGSRRSPPPDTYAPHVRRAGDPRPRSPLASAWITGLTVTDRARYGPTDEKSAIRVLWDTKRRTRFPCGALPAPKPFAGGADRGPMLPGPSSSTKHTTSSPPHRGGVPQRGRLGPADRCIPISDYKRRS